MPADEQTWERPWERGHPALGKVAHSLNHKNRASKPGNEGILPPGNEGILPPGNEGILPPGNEGILPSGNEGFQPSPSTDTPSPHPIA